MRKGKGKRMYKGKRNNNQPGNSSSSLPPPPWIELPRDVTVNILGRLGPEEILLSAQCVCSTWRSVCAEPSLWKVLDLKLSNIKHRTRHAGRLCRRAVDRSQGELIEITMEVFCSNNLLHYISERCSSHLRKLSLESCNVIRPRGLTEALKNLSRLEELHIFFTRDFSVLDIETIDVSCPMLNSFTFNNKVLSNFKMGYRGADNRLALSIAKNMPNLRRLRLVGNRMGNGGLLAILDGCPNLELLDLLLCFGVDLQCDLGIRCSEQVKMLRRPSDSDADCEWDARVYDYRDYGFENKGDSSDDYSDKDSVGCYSRYENNLFYDPYSDDSVCDADSHSNPADFNF